VIHFYSGNAGVVIFPFLIKGLCENPADGSIVAFDLPMSNTAFAEFVEIEDDRTT
jgi:hypothetical protein